LALLYKKRGKFYSKNVGKKPRNFTKSNAVLKLFLQSPLREFQTSDIGALLFFQTASHKTRYWSYFSALSVSTAILFFGKSVWIKKSVGEFLIDGYTDPLLTTYNLLSSSNSKFSSDKIGLIYQRNGSIAFDGVTNINTGEDDLTNMGNINYHNYVNHTENFEAECGHVTGSLGDFFGAMPIRKRRLDVFIPRLCR
jgi:hypothetical protein